MKNNYFDEVDIENQEIARQILSDSEKIDTNNIYDDKLLSNLENTVKGQRVPKKNVFKIATTGAIVVAACIVLIVGYGRIIDINNNQWKTTLPANKSDISKGVTEKNEESNLLQSTQDYQKIYEKMQYVGEPNVFLSEKTLKSSDEVMINESTKADISDVSGVDFYDTNEQTDNVHESDIVKTDGKYIYTLQRDFDSQKAKIIITQVERENLKNISNIQIKSNKKYYYNIGELYVKNNILVAVGTREPVKQEKGNNAVWEDCCFYNNSDVETVLFTYDISDKKKPLKISENIQEGAYRTSRMSNGFLYTISDKYMEKITKDECVPKVNGKCILPTDVYLPERIDDRTYTVITALDINNTKKYTKTVSVAGSVSTVYVSNKNIYLIVNSRKEVNISDTKAGKKALKEYTMEIYDNEKYPLTKAEKKNIKKMYEGVEEVSATIDTNAYKVTDTIDIIKYEYDNGKLNFVADQTVNGNANNNMLFDEKDGYLRFVTTEEEVITVSTKMNYYDQDNKLIYSTETAGEWITSTDMTNNLFVLNNKLNVKAEIRGLAEKESVYAARFLGNYGYFVTYENTDPLFSVDFSDMENPKIIGELKMPGFSQYLHFYTEDKLFGIGMDTDEKTGINKGLKIEMYDISGKSAKREAKRIFKDVDTSDALYEYKAIMIDSEKNLIGFSVEKDYYEENIKSFYFLYTYKNGKFKELASIDLEGYYDNIRGFYINDYVYIVIPDKKIEVISLEQNKIVGSASLK